MNITTTQETRSSCLAYANSTKAAVGFAVMVSDGASLRDEIKAGLHEGISFPDPKAIKARTRETTEEQRIEAVKYIHQLRHEGAKAREAAKQAKVSYQTYSRWRDELDMQYDGACLRGKFRTNTSALSHCF